jgi:ABC-type Fe3+ transport system permease subunit/sugar lactone lactonase YvrE
MNWPLLQNSLLVAGSTTALAVGFGLIAALWLATVAAHWRNLFGGAAIVALALPPFLVTNCWISLLGETGLLRAWLPFKIYSLGGTIWILALWLWPITVFAVLAAWRRLEAAHFECEPVMTGFALLRWLLLPAAKGELALAAVLTFVLALNNFAVPAILQTKVLPDEMWVRFNTQFDTLGALKLSVPLVIAPGLLLIWAARRGVRWPRGQGTVAARVFRRQLGAPWRIGCGAVAILVCALSCGLPLAQIITAKRTWAELAGAVEASTGAIWNSFWFAALAATVVVVAAVAFCSCRRAEAERCGSGKIRILTPAVTGISWLPFFIPGVLIGIALIKIFNRPVVVAFYQSSGIVLLALVIRYFALAGTAARHALATVDRDLVDAARLEGASRWQMFRFVRWPQIAPQMAAAWYVVYLLCLWDVESIVLVQPPGGETLALKIFNLLHYGYAGQVNALCLVLLGLAVLPLLVAAAFLRTRQFLSACAPNKVSRALPSAATMALLVGCSPTDSKHEAALPSKLFSRAIVIGSRGVGIGEFNKPRSLACDTNDNIFAVDMTGRVQKFTPAGEFVLSWQMPETTLGKAKGMGRDRAGNIMVVEPHYQRVNHFTPDGTLVNQWGCKGPQPGCFTLPRAVAMNSQGELFVSEYQGEERVQVFRASGPGAAARVELVRVIGQAGTNPGEFNRPEGICVDAQDRVYVADSCNHRIQVFTAAGEFIRQYGRAGSSLGELSYPYDIQVDARGYQFVCEFGNSRIQVFDADCKPVEIIGGPGAEPGRFANPWSVALDARGDLYVADSQNHRVQKLVRRPGAIGLRRPPETGNAEPRT